MCHCQLVLHVSMDVQLKLYIRIYKLESRNAHLRQRWSLVPLK